MTSHCVAPERHFELEPWLGICSDIPPMFSPLFRLSRSICMLFILADSAAALDLATFDIIDQGGGVGDMTGLRITIYNQPPARGAQPTYRLGDYLLITPADVGTTFIINGLTDTDFTAFQQAVTNGVDD